MTNANNEVAAILAAMSDKRSSMVEQLLDLIVAPEAKSSAYYNYEGIMAFLQNKKVIDSDDNHDTVTQAYA